MKEGNRVLLDENFLCSAIGAGKYRGGQTAAPAQREGVKPVWLAAGRFGLAGFCQICFPLDCGHSVDSFLISSLRSLRWTGPLVIIKPPS
jgi:hypothetical protein